MAGTKKIIFCCPSNRRRNFLFAEGRRNTYTGRASPVTFLAIVKEESKGTFSTPTFTLFAPAHNSITTMAAVGELSSATRNLSEASGDYMSEKNWQFEEDHRVGDCNIAVVKQSVDSSNNKSHSVRNSVAVFEKMMNKPKPSTTGLRGSRNIVTTKPTRSNPEDTCSSTQMTDEDERLTGSLTSNSENGDANSAFKDGRQQQPTEYEVPPMMLEMEQYQESDETDQRTSLDSQVVGESKDWTVEGGTIHSEDTVKTSGVVGENNKARYSKAALVLLDNRQDSPNKAIVESLQMEQSQPMDEVLIQEEPSGAGCDDLVLDLCSGLVEDICNGLADSTLYACNKVLTCVLPAEEQDDAGEDDEKNAQTESNEIFIPEEEEEEEEPELAALPVVVEPIVPQVVRKGHVLPMIVKKEQDPEKPTESS